MDLNQKYLLAVMGFNALARNNLRAFVILVRTYFRWIVLSSHHKVFPDLLDMLEDFMCKSYKKKLGSDTIRLRKLFLRACLGLHLKYLFVVILVSRFLRKKHINGHLHIKTFTTMK